MLNWVRQKSLLYVNALRQNNQDEKCAEVSERMVEALTKYDEIAGMWPCVSGFKIKGKQKLFYFDTKNFIMLIQATYMYNRETALITLGERRMKSIDKNCLVEKSI